MKDSKNYYEILEVSEGASVQVISAAYRTLAAKYHPDKNPEHQDSSDRMAAINVAFGVLSDPIRRKLYDDEIESDKNANPKPEDESPKTPAEPLVDENNRNYSGPTGILIVASILVLIFLVIRIITSPEGSAKNDSATDRYMSWFYAEKRMVGDSGFPRDYEGAMNDYKEMSNKNLYTDGRAEFRIAEIYLYGLGVEKNYKEAYKWLLIATGRFNCAPLPYFLLGYLYEAGVGIEKNPTLAYRNYLQATSRLAIENNDSYNLMTTNSLENDRIYTAIAERLKHASVQDAAKKMADKIEMKLTKEEIRNAQKVGK